MHNERFGVQVHRNRTDAQLSEDGSRSHMDGTRPERRFVIPIISEWAKQACGRIDRVVLWNLESGQVAGSPGRMLMGQPSDVFLEGSGRIEMVKPPGEYRRNWDNRSNMCARMLRVSQ